MLLLCSYRFSIKDILNYIIGINHPSKKEFTKIILKNKIYSYYFLDNIYENHLSLIEQDKRFIKLCLQFSLDEEKIIRLVDRGFKFSEEDMEETLSQKRYLLLERMCQIMKTINVA